MAKKTTDALAEDLLRAQKIAESYGGRMLTGKQIFASREDFYLGEPIWDSQMKGPTRAGWRVLFTGPTGAGKTTDALQLVAAHRRMFPERLALVVDIEDVQEGEPSRAKVVNWDPDDPYLQILKWEGSGESLFDMLRKMLYEQIPISCVIFDSLSGLAPKQELTDSKGVMKPLDKSSQMASSASMLSTAFRVTTGLFARCNVTQGWVFQRRVDPSKMGAIQIAMGNAALHYADLILQYSGGINFKGSVYGNYDLNVSDKDQKPTEVCGATSSKVMRKKRKGLARPMSEITYDIDFTSSLDPHRNVIHALDFQGKLQATVFNIPLGEAEALVKDEVAAFLDTPEGKFKETNKTPSVSIEKGTLRLSGRSRAWYIEWLSRANRACPALYKHLLTEVYSGMRPPRRAVYGRLPDSYPTIEELDKIKGELESIEMEAEIVDLEEHQRLFGEIMGVAVA